MTRMTITVAAALFLVAGAGCKKAKKVEDSKPHPTAGTQAGSEAAKPAPSLKDAVLLERVNFALDRYELSEEAKEKLAENAEKLKAQPKVRIRVEGHADERGSTEYNLALSEKRAAAVKRYLTDLGVDAARIETLAFGEERPLVDGHDESAWSQNRRGDLVVTGGSASAKVE